MFKNIFENNNIDNTTTETTKLQQSLDNLDKKAYAIQSNFNFAIPDYILEEIVENEDSRNFVNLHYLINCAVVNEKISFNNAQILKQIYSFKC